MIAVPSIADDPARRDETPRPRHSADHCRLRPKQYVPPPAPSLSISISGSIIGTRSDCGASCYCPGTGQSMVVGGDFVLENVDQMKALLTRPDRRRARETARVPGRRDDRYRDGAWWMRLSVLRCPAPSAVAACYRENLKLRPANSS